MDFVKKAKGPYCKNDEYAVVTFKGWDETGALRFDSMQQEFKKSEYFRIGHYQASKCWDIAA